MTVTVAQVRDANAGWFSRENRTFFGDISYKILHDKKKNAYLVRQTYGFSDMFGNPKVAHYKVNPLGQNLEILTMLDEFFESLPEVKQALTNRKMGVILS